MTRPTWYSMLRDSPRCIAWDQAEVTALRGIVLELGTEISRDLLPHEAFLYGMRLAECADPLPEALSTGAQSCVAASAMAEQPAVLCAEPTGPLDCSRGWRGVACINQELATSTVVILHNPAIAGIADRAVRLTDGRIFRAKCAVKRQHRELAR